MIYFIQATPSNYIKSVNGMVKTWKRDTSRIKVPLKRGLYETGYLVNNTFEGGQFELNLNEVSLAQHLIKHPDPSGCFVGLLNNNT